MTIIQPNKNKLKLNFVTLLLIGAIVAGAVLTIITYNQSVQLSYALDQQLTLAKELRAQNADLENELYEKLGLQNVEELAAKLGLVRERRPEYLAVQ